MASRPSQPMSRALSPIQQTGTVQSFGPALPATETPAKPRDSQRRLGQGPPEGEPSVRLAPMPQAQAEPQATLEAGPGAGSVGACPPLVRCCPRPAGRRQLRPRPANPLLRLGQSPAGTAGQGRRAVAVGFVDVHSPRMCWQPEQETSVHPGPAPGRALCWGSSQVSGDPICLTSVGLTKPGRYKHGCCQHKPSATAFPTSAQKGQNPTQTTGPAFRHSSHREAQLGQGHIPRGQTMHTPTQRWGHGREEPRGPSPGWTGQGWFQEGNFLPKEGHGQWPRTLTPSSV